MADDTGFGLAPGVGGGANGGRPSGQPMVQQGRGGDAPVAQSARPSGSLMVPAGQTAQPKQQEGDGDAVGS